MGRRLRGIFPAAALFFIAPLIGEFLLGNMPITMLGMLAILAPVNGGAALLIREFVRRSGRGWGSILLLGLAYGILEEAFLTETLFNPNYLGLNLQLLQPAFIASLGIGLRYTIFVLTLHTVWSIGVPIALVEALVPERALAPWLGRFGKAMVAVIFTLAAVSMASFSIHRGPQYFEASPRQFLWSAMACLALMGLAFGLRKPRRNLVNSDVPGPWVGGLLTFGAASIFMIVPSKMGRMGGGVLLAARCCSNCRNLRLVWPNGLGWAPPVSHRGRSGVRVRMACLLGDSSTGDGEQCHAVGKFGVRSSGCHSSCRGCARNWRVPEETAALRVTAA